MDLGDSLFNARKRSGLSQEDVAEKLGISRQTVSKWETGETVPDIRQCKKMASLYNMTLDELIDFDVDEREIMTVIDKTDPKVHQKIDWTKAWGKKYSVLLQYQNIVDIQHYADALCKMLDELEDRYSFGAQDAMLVLKDILYGVWKERKSKTGRQ